MAMRISWELAEVLFQGTFDQLGAWEVLESLAPAALRMASVLLRRRGYTPTISDASELLSETYVRVMRGDLKVGGNRGVGGPPPGLKPLEGGPRNDDATGFLMSLLKRRMLDVLAPTVRDRSERPGVAEDVGLSAGLTLAAAPRDLMEARELSARVARAVRTDGVRPRWRLAVLCLDLPEHLERTDVPPAIPATQERERRLPREADDLCERTLQWRQAVTTASRRGAGEDKAELAWILLTDEDSGFATWRRRDPDGRSEGLRTLSRWQRKGRAAVRPMLSDLGGGAA